MSNTVDLYDNVYGDFGGNAEVAVRRSTCGEDIGQSSWMTASEYARSVGEALDEHPES